MVLSIARQSVVIKCNLNSSIMTGNYEFYYAAGLLYKLMEIKTDEILQPMELLEKIHLMIQDFSTEDTREQHLSKMLRYYKPVDEFNHQMKELFLLGYGEQHIWQELLPDA